ncbi:hypothetical protein NDU88_000214 [Pleurodeles waltl]|uniref:Uncharacterized protein n=1 Tax=Pleurodeles waltl TaxID=8319 RepID=A0AAV7VWQ9_PLEWA|nr:hypothetical protein NDU88_000214 [Pleurodeles waltl]
MPSTPWQYMSLCRYPAYEAEGHVPSRLAKLRHFQAPDVADTELGATSNTQSAPAHNYNKAPNQGQQAHPTQKAASASPRRYEPCRQPAPAPKRRSMMQPDPRVSLHQGPLFKHSGPHLTSQSSEARDTNQSSGHSAGQSKQHLPPPASTADVSSTVQCNSTFRCKPRPGAQLRSKRSNVDLPPPSARLSPNQGQARLTLFSGRPSPPSARSLSSAARTRCDQPGPPHSRQFAPAPEAGLQHLAPRGAVQRWCPPFTRGAQTAGTSAEPRTPSAPEGRPGPSEQSALRGRARPPGMAPHTPVPKGTVQAAVRPDCRRPQPPGGARAPQQFHLPPAPRSSRERHAAEHTQHQRRVCLLRPHCASGPSPPDQGTPRPAPSRGPPQESMRCQRS